MRPQIFELFIGQFPFQVLVVGVGETIVSELQRTGEFLYIVVRASLERKLSWLARLTLGRQWASPSSRALALRPRSPISGLLL